MTGEKISTDRDGNPLIQITRHHYLVSDWYNKLDCTLKALVPIPTDDHHPRSTPHDLEWEIRFRLAKKYIDSGIAVIPSWWSITYQRQYEAELQRYGIEYRILDNRLLNTYRNSWYPSLKYGNL